MKKTIYFDNASTTWPKPESVLKATEDFCRNICANAGRSAHKLARETGDLVDSARETISDFFNAGDPSRVCFTAGATDSINIAVKGVLRAGDHVIATPYEHNAVLRPLNHMADTAGVEISYLPPGKDGIVPSDALEKMITPKTKLVAVTHSSNITGCVQPIEEIGAVCRKRNVLLLVDGAQSAGECVVDFKKQNIDLFAGAGHKFLFGFQGIGFLYVREGVEIGQWRQGGTGGCSIDNRHPCDFPTHLEAGTKNAPGICSLKAGIEFIRDTGLDALNKKVKKILSIFIEEFEGHPGIRILGTHDLEKHTAAMSFDLGKIDPGPVAEALDADYAIAVRAGKHCAPRTHIALGTKDLGTLRAAPSCFSTEDEAFTFTKAVKEILKTGV